MGCAWVAWDAADFFFPIVIYAICLLMGGEEVQLESTNKSTRCHRSVSRGSMRHQRGRSVRLRILRPLIRSFIQIE